MEPIYREFIIYAKRTILAVAGLSLLYGVIDGFGGAVGFLLFGSKQLDGASALTLVFFGWLSGFISGLHSEKLNLIKSDGIASVILIVLFSAFVFIVQGGLGMDQQELMRRVPGMLYQICAFIFIFVVPWRYSRKQQ